MCSFGVNLQRFGRCASLARGRCIKRYVAGITNIDSSGAVIIPPTIGAAIRCITSDRSRARADTIGE